MKTYLPLLLVTLLFSCKPNENDVPAYLHVPAFDVFTTDPLMGTASHKITDVWVYLDDEIQGVYELPVTLPILASGPTKITLSPGILQNGISTTRVQYPFYTDTSFTVDLVPTETDTIRPSVTYRGTSSIILNEDFENGNEFSNIQRVNNSPEAFEGDAFGRFVIDTTRTGRIITASTYPVDNSEGVVMFIELNYKTSHTMQAGIIATSDVGVYTITKVNIAPQDEWNKIYLNFTQELNGTLATSFQFYLDVNATNDGEPIEMYIDNVKILLE